MEIISKIKRSAIALLMLFTITNTYADCYTDLRQKAIEAFNRGEYQNAKNLFISARDDCPDAPQNNDLVIQIQKCDQAIQNANQRSETSQQSSSATTLSLSKNQVNASEGSSSEYISITSNRSWYISGYPASWCQVSKSSSGLTITISSNPNTYSRSTSIKISTSDNQKTITVNVNQSAKTEMATTNSSSSAYFICDATSLSFESNGGTKKLFVTASVKWTYEAPSWLHLTWNNDGYLNVYCSTNSGEIRSGYIKLLAKDKDITKLIWVSQKGNTSKNTSSRYSSQSSTSTSSSRHSSIGNGALRQFNAENGIFEIYWWGIRGMIGTGVGMEHSLLAMRIGCVGLEPVVINCEYDFLTKKLYGKYQPDVKFYIPWNSEAAIIFAAGPSISIINKKDIWFMAEAGIHWHYGRIGSSNFFLRYDGIFSVGASFQLSTGW